MEIKDNEFGIVDNEFAIPEPDPLDNLLAFIVIGNEQYFLDEHYKEATRQQTLPAKIGSFALKELKSLRAYLPLARMMGLWF